MRTWIPLTLFIVCLTAPLKADTSINSRQRLLEDGIDQTHVAVGAFVKDLAFVTCDGNSHRVVNARATALVFLSTSCPLAKRYTQRLNRLDQTFASRGVKLVGVFANSEDTVDSINQHAEKMKFSFPIAKDDYAYLATRVGASMTPQAVVIDEDGSIRYRGAIDDNRYENRVKNTYLADALSSVLSDERLQVPQTKTLGCSIHLASANDVGQVTYSEHIARILNDNCANCHRTGQVAPFSLTSYSDAKTWATEINHYTQARLMPPWKAEPGFGDFEHVKRLTEQQLTLMQRWADEGAAQGPIERTPPPPLFNDEWTNGKPDFVVQMLQEYTIAAEGEDVYRHFIVPTNFEHDMYVEATDVIPGNRQTVHHVIAYVDTSGRARELDAEDPGPGYTRFGDVGFEPVSMLGGWAPGIQPSTSPAGTGFWLPKGADIVLQVHYYRTGVEEKDRTKVGLYFTDHPKPVAIDMGVAINTKFVIPPGEEHYQVNAAWLIEEPVYAISVLPHMHLLGKEMKVTATLPNGTVEPLIWIKDWDFNWQNSYRYRKPLYFPKGTKVEVVSYFDNSNENPNNPHDPPKPVGWGEKTTDEMCIAFVEYLSASKWQPK